MAIRLQVRTRTITVVLSREGGFVEQEGRFRISVYADGADLGNAEQRTTTVPWQGSDGDRVEVTGYGNRDQTYKVKVVSLTGDDRGLVAGEEYLSQVVGIRSELWWQAPSASEPTVYDVETARIDQDVNDGLELGASGDATQPVRAFTLVFTCQPFGRRPVETVVEALSSGTETVTVTPVVTVLFNGASTAGWTAKQLDTHATNLGVSLASGGGVMNTNLPTTSTLLGSTTLGISMGTDRLVRVTFNVDPVGPAPAMVLTVPTFAATAPVAQVGNLAYYLIPAGVTSFSTAFWLLQKGQRVTIKEIARVNVMPYSTTARQGSRTFEVGGTARTSVSATIRHDKPLGDVLLYLRQEDGYGNQPPMRPFRTAASTTTILTNTSAYNGSIARLSSTTQEVYDVPATMMPEAPYLVVLRHLPSAVDMGFTITASTVLNGKVLGSWNSGVLWRTGMSTSAFNVTELGLVLLPTIRVPERVASIAKVRVTLTATANTDGDELLLFDTRRGRLVRVAAGEAPAPVVGGESNVVFVDAPSMASPRQAIYLGTNLDRTDARHAAGLAIGQRNRLEVNPGLVNAFVASNQLSPAVSFSFFERGFHHLPAVTP